MTTKLTTAAVATAAIGLLTLILVDWQPAWGQRAIRTQAQPPVETPPPPPNPTLLPGAVPFWDITAPQPARVVAELQLAINKLRDADGEEAKADARDELALRLAGYFDRDMEKREKEISKIEERVRKLRAQIDRRQAARNDIIELQLKVLVNQAEGLGFFGRSSGQHILPQWQFWPAPPAESDPPQPPAFPGAAPPRAR